MRFDSKFTAPNMWQIVYTLDELFKNAQQSLVANAQKMGFSVTNAEKMRVRKRSPEN